MSTRVTRVAGMASIVMACIIVWSALHKDGRQLDTARDTWRFGRLLLCFFLGCFYHASSEVQQKTIFFSLQQVVITWMAVHYLKFCQVQKRWCFSTLKPPWGIYIPYIPLKAKGSCNQGATCPLILVPRRTSVWCLSILWWSKQGGDWKGQAV